MTFFSCESEVYFSFFFYINYFFSFFKIRQRYVEDKKNLFNLNENKLKGSINYKAVGLGVGALAVMWTLRSYYKGSATPKELIAKAASSGELSKRWPFLEAGLGVALEQDLVLEDLVERMTPFFRFDEEVGRAFVETAAGAAEYQLRLDEVVHKRSIAKSFGAFTTTLVSRTRELRRALRDKAPAMLEEFDEVAADVQKFAKDSHDNFWKEGFS